MIFIDSQKLVTEISRISTKEKCNVELYRIGKGCNNYIIYDINFAVSEPVAPVINDTNLNDTELMIDSWQFLSWHCGGAGIPMPVVLWLKDGEILSAGDETSSYELSSGNETLIIKSITTKEEGTYVCRLENKIGRAEKSITLKLKGELLFEI